MSVAANSDWRRWLREETQALTRYVLAHRLWTDVSVVASHHSSEA